jgi:hypothetical protein
MSVEERFARAANTRSDINEHLQTLSDLASESESVLECGVRTVVSSWAFLHGLTKNGKAQKKLMCCDLRRSVGVNELEKVCLQNNVEFAFHAGNDLTIPMAPHDLIFIDTWHIYGHLKRELALMHPYAKKYIALHDTEVDKIQGESIRCNFNIPQQVVESGYPIEEITKGLGPAVEEFLAAHPEWRIKAHYTNNNGLTVLERVSP